MYDIIDHSSVAIGTKVNVHLKRHTSNLTAFMDKIRHFERVGGRLVDNSHPLVKLVNSLDVSFARESVMDVLQDAITAEPVLANAHGINHSGHIGDVFKNNFYPCKEIYVLDKNIGSLSDVMELDEGYSWRYLEPIKTMKVPRGYNPLNVPKNWKHGDFDDTDYACVSINIRLLSIMYYKWAIANSELNAGEQESTVMFVSRYLIPNMFISQLEACLLDISYCAIGDIPYFVSEYTGKLFAKDFVSEIYIEYQDVWKHLPKRRLSGRTALKAIPSLNGMMIDQVKSLEDIETSQSYCGWVFGYIMYIKLISSMIKKSGDPDNKYANRVRRVLRKINGYGILDKLRDKTLIELVEGDLATIEINLDI